ncbi:hypothetical protein, partial [Actibacterium sp. MT2.3-13A]|uniref:hypothetical protein n=1 Tax=Actibacterium sp. MT2.3-13A TaxID=2828332 RepID=UPI001BAD5A5E
MQIPMAPGACPLGAVPVDTVPPQPTSVRAAGGGVPKFPFGKQEYRFFRKKRLRLSSSNRKYAFTGGAEARLGRQTGGWVT